jgi:4-oxalocrotonate tautomerase
MPYVNIKLIGKLKREQKEEICEGVSAVLERVAGKDPEHTYVVIEEIAAENWGKGGKLFG